ncbi:MAG TPA: NAD-binding protein, partial [Acidimicrobiales bacterium]
WGYAVGDPKAPVWDRLYAIPTVFALNMGDDAANLDWRIQAARFLAPLVFASTFFAATAAVFREQFDRFKLRFTSGHVVIAGLGEKGSRLAQSYGAAGRQVVVIESDPSNPHLATARRNGVTVLAGSAADPLVLAEARVDRATDLVVVCDDATNAEVVAVARQVERSSRRPALRASVHLVDPQLSQLLRNRALSTGTSAVRCDFFNIYQLGARVWLDHSDPLVAGPDGSAPHLVVFGVGRLGESLVVSAAQRWAEATGPDDPPLQVTIVESDASARMEGLRLRNPALVGHAEFHTIDLDQSRPSAEGVDAFRALLARGDVDVVYVCEDDDTHALSNARTVRQGLGSSRAIVQVRTRSDAGLALLVEDDGGADASGGIRGFPLFDRTCSADAIDGGTNEAVARAIHADYLARAEREGGGRTTVQPWSELDEATKESNRRAADSLVSALGTIDCVLTPLYGWDGSGFALTDAEIEVLARTEHERWRAERAQAGWTLGSPRDDDRKIHPGLVGWDDATELDREFNREAARGLPAMLARAGFEIVHLLPTAPAAASIRE